MGIMSSSEIDLLREERVLGNYTFPSGIVQKALQTAPSHTLSSRVELATRSLDSDKAKKRAWRQVATRPFQIFRS